MKKSYYIIISLLIIVFHLNVFSRTLNDSLFFHYTLDMDSDREKPFLSLSSLLEYLPGTYQFGIQTPGQFKSLLINGTRESHSVILINGLPLRDYLTGVPYLSLIPVESINKIDLYPGLNPFGINAIGGVINIQTDKFDENKPYTKFVYRTGSGLYSDFEVSYGQPVSSKIKIFTGVMLKKFGLKESTNEELPYRKYKAQKTRANVTYALNDHINFRYAILSNRHSLRIPFNIPLDSSITPSRNIFRIDHTLQSSLNLPYLKTHLWLKYTSEKMRLEEFRFVPQQKLSLQSQQMKIVQNAKLFIPLSWGLEYSHCNLTDTSGVQHAYFHNSFFMHMNFPVSNRITFFTALDLNDSKYTDPEFNFSGFISYKPANMLNFTVEYDQNSTFPKLPCRYGYPNFFNTPLTGNDYYYRQHDLGYNENLNLLNEKSERIQLVCQYGSRKKYRLSSLLYYQTCENLISVNQVNQGSNIMLGCANNFSTSYTGINSELFFTIFKNVQFSSSLNVLQSQNKDTLNHIDLPLLQGVTTLCWNHDFFKDDLHLSLFASLKYWSGFSFFALTDEHYFSRQEILPNAILNGKASFRIMDHAYITFAVDNILNQKISEKYHVFIPYSFYRIGISWELFN